MPSAATDDQVRNAYRLCEREAGRDKPHLYAAAQLFAWPETRRAFAATYASMRVIDDYVDDIPERSNLTESSRQDAARHVDAWMDQVRRAKDNSSDRDGIWPALADTFRRFDLPLAPWEELARAMHSDLSTFAFRDWDHLQAYMAGASVAPAVVFMYLVLMRPDGSDSDGRFRSPWPYEQVVAATEDLAIFCYWVHILRDVASDLARSGSGLVYIPEADLQRFGLRIDDLHEMRVAGRATPAYCQLAHYEAERAHRHLRRGRSRLPELLAVAPTENAQALTRLVETYVVVLQELATRNYDVFAVPVT